SPHKRFCQIDISKCHFDQSEASWRNLKPYDVISSEVEKSQTDRDLSTTVEVTKYKTSLMTSP
ncbi:MAG: hypothetical protein K2K85_02975, partial [Clostridia bacterium]|nr:hypothetical protein [Clostridia bacterium]